MPDVSVVIPTRDRRDLLLRTLGAVRAQAGVQVEIVVVDDGATDGTSEAVAALCDERIVLLRSATPGGVSSARNRGCHAASADWIAFLDDDDLWAPEKLARQLAALQHSGRQWAFSGSVSFTTADGIIAGCAPPAAESVVAMLPQRNCVPAGASNVIVHRTLLQAAGDFDTRLRHMADWDLWIRFGTRALPAVVDAPDVAYRLHDGNASADAAVIEHELALLTERHVEARGGAPLDRAFALRWVAWNQLRVGQRPAAARSYVRAVAAGDVRSAARAVAALVDPGVVARVMRASLDAAWVAPARHWLTAIETGTA